MPSQSVRFWKRHKKKIFKIFAEEQPDVILSTSPQHSMHWAAKSIKRRHPEKLWVADFRDPYTIDIRYAPAGISKFMFPFHRMFERSIYDRADLLIHAIPLHARWARYVFTEAREKIHILTNGIPENLINYVKAKDKNTNSAFTISSVGRIDDDNASKLALMALRLLKEGFNIQLRLVGQKPHLPQNLKDQLGDRLVLTGPVNHDTALSEISSSDLLVSCLSEERSRVYGISSKLFEYLATGKPILSINPTRPDRVFAREFENIVFLGNPTVNDLCGTVPGLMKQDKNLSAPEVSDICKRFNRREQVARLAEDISKWLDGSYR
ncbi:MAG: glycosyltransferase [Desulfobacteraceae bacterium]|nr:glycosyltransferase [Desulfobacteraceae bacterium]